MFARLKDFRRIATRYDKLARNFLAGASIAATVVWWLNSVRTLGHVREHLKPGFQDRPSGIFRKIFKNLS